MKTRRTTLHANEKRLFFAACSLFLAMFGAYIYFVSASVVHVIVRKEVSQEIAHLNSTLSELETEYIELKNDIDTAVLESRGFEPIDERVFVTKTPTNLVLSRNDES